MHFLEAQICICVYACRSQSPRSSGKEDEAKEAKGLFPGRSGKAGAEGHE